MYLRNIHVSYLKSCAIRSCKLPHFFPELGKRNLLLPLNAQPLFSRSTPEISRIHTSSACLTERSHSVRARDESRATAFSVKWAVRMSIDEAFAHDIFSHGQG